jgi:hypothetical protein
MALHLPAHQAGLAGPHVFRNALLAIGVAILAVVLIVAALTIKPFATSTTTTMTPAQALIEFRAGERATWNAMVAESNQSATSKAVDQRDSAIRTDTKADAAAKALVQFRADERNMK